ncbi:hypothetical protein MAPG_03237 [Magnaporthiopsis poae ATCC 64411]|uniref:HMG box domain-containing protein n=1 Tax=Magnaporthiopsis poae (strain ATCC 64411 / 73-15) TaxID=644358 RepID=A0A0C4DTH0_MAGP6|nr:hypothetical protein MAPG_03237 [Magnaporthiopsis poae ATCC 64411]
MWSVVRPAALQVAPVHGANASLLARRGLGCLSARVVLNRSASCAYRLTVVARSMATAAAKTKTARKPAATATKASATKPKGRAAGAQKTAAKTTKSARTTRAAKATKTTKGARAVKSKAKSKAARPKKKRAGKGRKPALTPEQKMNADKRKLSKQILHMPTQLPARSWVVYLTQKTQGKSHNLIEDVATVSKSFKELSAAELNNLKEIAQANLVANKAAYKEWVARHTPAEVNAANKARARLRRVHKASAPEIKDPRLPKRPMGPFFFYVHKGFTPRDPAQQTVIEHAKAAGAQWKKLSEEERKPFIDMSNADKVRYEVEKKSVGLA